jgi:hypothetical protein
MPRSAWAEEDQEMTLGSRIAFGAAAIVAAGLSACGGSSPGATIDKSTQRGTLIESPPVRLASLDAATLATQLGATEAGRQMLALAGKPACGVDFHYFHYQTVGGKGEQTTASGALMAPTGGQGCSGPRPILAYTHGTTFAKTYNIAAITDPANAASMESALIAAFFAAHGYIVVASNYAGYDSSPLPYHPYLNADQQSKDVMDAIAAARTALSRGLPAGVTDNGKLFVTGYSQGGHVAMATQRAMEAAGMAVTAAAPMSGPYAMLAFGDAAFTYGNPGLEGTFYYPMVVNSYQRSYGNVYTTPTDVYSPTYATGIDTLLPSLDPEALISAGKLPAAALFDSTTPGTGAQPGTGIPALDAALAVPDPATHPVGALAFGDPFLFTNAMRVAYARDALATPDGVVPAATTFMPPAANPAFGMRADLKKNDLRGWLPKAPVMLCGAMDDADVPYQINTLTMKALWAPQVAAGLVRVVDVDPATDGDPAKAGQIATRIGGIAARVLASEPTAEPGKIAADVQATVLSDPSFAAYFSAPGVPNSPQGAMAAEAAALAAQVTVQALGQHVTDPAGLARAVGFALLENFHVMAAAPCLTAAQGFFAHF